MLWDNVLVDILYKNYFTYLVEVKQSLVNKLSMYNIKVL